MTSTRATVVAPAILLAAVLALTLGVYWVGLSGPFLFDDLPTFSTLRAWSDGKASLGDVLFSNTSWLTYRSLAMGSFALNTWLFGLEPFGFKLGNLLLHFASGLAGYAFLCNLLYRDGMLSPRHRLVAALIIAVWLLHPLNVSTVLYSVQRMAQIATLCCLLGMWLYVALRSRMERGSRFAWIGLFVGIPLLTFLGIQGKQNAAVLPALCLVLELAYFGIPRTWPRAVIGFHSLFLALPLALATIGTFLRPDVLLGGYGEYAFSPTQRLLTEGRVLSDYIRMLLIPYPPGMGVYTDDYVASSGLFSPITTALALAALATTSIVAWRVRSKLPSVFAGWFLFLVAHSIEGTLLPLELYYEHRNYLPAFGLFLACAGLVSAIGKMLTKSGIRSGRIGVTIAASLLAVLALQTHGRARVWSDKNVLAESALANHPDSARATITYLGTAMEAGDTARAFTAATEIIKTTSSPRVRGLILLFKIRMECAVYGRTSPTSLSDAVRNFPEHIDLTTANTFSYLNATIRRAPCTGISRTELASAIANTVDRAAGQSDNAFPKYFLRHSAARLYFDAGDWPRALTQARMAWQPNMNPAGGLILVKALAHQGLLGEAEQVYRQARDKKGVQTREDVSALREMRSLIDHGSHPAASRPNVP